MESSPGILARFKNNLKEIIQEYSHGFSVETALVGAAYAFISFILGFVLKNYGKYILILALSIVIAFWFSAYFNLIIIKHAYVKQLLGMESVHSIQDCCYLLIKFIKSNLILNIICLVSFIIGWKIG